MNASMSLLQERGLAQNLQSWSKDTHLDRMRESAHFRFTREVFLHHIEQGDAARFMEMMLTNAFSHQFKLKTITEQEIGFDRLSRRSAPTYRVRANPLVF